MLKQTPNNTPFRTFPITISMTIPLTIPRTYNQKCALFLYHQSHHQEYSEPYPIFIVPFLNTPLLT